MHHHPRSSSACNKKKSRYCKTTTMTISIPTFFQYINVISIVLILLVSLSFETWTIVLSSKATTNSFASIIIDNSNTNKQNNYKNNIVLAAFPIQDNNSNKKCLWKSKSFQNSNGRFRKQQQQIQISNKVKVQNFISILDRNINIKSSHHQLNLKNYQPLSFLFSQVGSSSSSLISSNSLLRRKHSCVMLPMTRRKSIFRIYSQKENKGAENLTKKESESQDDDCENTFENVEEIQEYVNKLGYKLDVKKILTYQKKKSKVTENPNLDEELAAMKLAKIVQTVEGKEVNEKENSTKNRRSHHHNQREGHDNDADLIGGVSRAFLRQLSKSTSLDEVNEEFIGHTGEEVDDTEIDHMKNSINMEEGSRLLSSKSKNKDLDSTEKHSSTLKVSQNIHLPHDSYPENGEDDDDEKMSAKVYSQKRKKDTIKDTATGNDPNMDRKQQRVDGSLFNKEFDYKGELTREKRELQEFLNIHRATFDAEEYFGKEKYKRIQQEEEIELKRLKLQGDLNEEEYSQENLSTFEIMKQIKENERLKEKENYENEILRNSKDTRNPDIQYFEGAKEFDYRSPQKASRGEREEGEGEEEFVLLDGMYREEVVYKKTSIKGETNELYGYIVSSRNAQKFWQKKESHVVMVLTDVLGYEDDKTRKLVDHMAFVTDTVFFIPDLFRKKPWCDDLLFEKDYYFHQARDEKMENEIHREKMEKIANKKDSQEYEEWRKQHTEENVMTDIEGAYEYITQRYNATSVGLMGFCFGGGRALEVLARSSLNKLFTGSSNNDGTHGENTNRGNVGMKFNVGAVFYPTRYNVKEIGNELKDIPLLAIFGGKDDIPGARLEDAKALEKVLRVEESSVDNKREENSGNPQKSQYLVRVFKNRGHAFAHRPQEDIDATEPNDEVKEGEEAVTLATAWLEIYMRKYGRTTYKSNGQSNFWLT